MLVRGLVPLWGSSFPLFLLLSSLFFLFSSSFFLFLSFISIAVALLPRSQAEDGGAGDAAARAEGIENDHDATVTLGRKPNAPCQKTHYYDNDD